MAHQAFKMEAEVRPGGRLELDVPLPAGSRVEVIVLAQQVDGFSDLVEAATSSTEFWDNPIDDAEWNHG
jgi:hypothetical protein